MATIAFNFNLLGVVYNKPRRNQIGGDKIRLKYIFLRQINLRIGFSRFVYPYLEVYFGKCLLLMSSVDTPVSVAWNSNLFR